MKKISVKKVSAVSSSLPSRSILDAARGFSLRTGSKAMANDGQDVLRDLIRSSPDDTIMSVAPTVRIELDVDGALPTTNYANFWVGDQLLLGTILDEKAQKVTGFVHRPVKGMVEVRVDQPDGTQRTFQLDVDTPDDP